MSRQLKGDGDGFKVYLSPFQGTLCEQSKDPKDGFIEKEYKNKDGVTCTKYVKEYSSVTGLITALTYRSNDVKGLKINSWNLQITDADGDIVLQFGADSKVGQTLLKLLPNINVDLYTKVATFGDKEKGSTVLIMYQGEEGFTASKENAVQWAYKKDTPNGIPQAKQRSDGKWDFGDVNEFLYNKGIEFSEMLKGRITTKVLSPRNMDEDPNNMDDILSEGDELNTIPF